MATNQTATGKCPAEADPNSPWGSMCPNIGAAYFFAILFGLTMVAHIIQAIIYKKGYSWVITMSALWQCANYAFRIMSIKQYDNSTWYQIWFILILLAPLWINAYVYMVLGRMVFNFTTKAKILKINAWRFGLYFVLLDITAFLVQAVGAILASGSGKPPEQVKQGLNIYMGGVGLQQLFIFGFIYVAYQFQREMNHELPLAARKQPLRLLYVLYIALALITIRIIFRLIEYSKGITSSIPNHEQYQYIFDSLPMLIALVLFNIVHPGRVMPGKKSDFPSRKERKQMGKNHIWGQAGGDHTSLRGRVSSELDESPRQGFATRQNSTFLKTGAQTSYGVV